MKTLPLIIVFLLVSLGFTFYQITPPACAAEPTTVEVLSHFGFNNIVQISNQTFRAGVYRITLYAEFAAYHAQNELSYYLVNTTTYNTIFADTEGGFGYLTTPITKNFTIPGQFSLSLLSLSSYRFFVETSRNTDGQVHAKVYRNLDNYNMIFICFEDLYYGGDRDFQDMVVSIEFLYALQFYLRIVTPYGSPLSEGWYEDGTTVYASLDKGEENHQNGTRHVFTSWSGDASGTSYSQSNPIVMSSNKTAIANWKTQYSLSVVTVPAGLTPQPSRNPSGETNEASSWWYDASTEVTLTAQLVSGYVFNYWSIDGSSQPVGKNPITISMTAPHAAIAYYNQIPPLSVSIRPLAATIPLGQHVVFFSTVTGGLGPYAYQWFLNGAPVEGANADTWAFTPLADGVYYIYLRVTDSRNTTAQSETARIEVLSVPIGGYSVSTGEAPSKLQLLCLLLFLASGSALITIFRRRKK